MRRLNFFFACLALAVATTSPAQPSPPKPPTPEARAARAYQAAVKDGPLALRAFLVEFPKGADLHVHLSGAVYAETFIEEAGQDKLCIDPAGLKFARDDQSNPIQEPCAAPLVPASQVPVPDNQALYDKLIDAFSMRSFVPAPSWSGHDQFFATFGKFGGINRSHYSEWIDEAASRAAAQNQQYLELMMNPSTPHLQGVVDKIVWPAGMPDDQTFDKLLKQVIDDPGLQKDIDSGRQYALDLDTTRKTAEHCADPAQAAPACQVNIRYIFQVSRGNLPAYVFAQTVLGFEIAKANISANKGGYVGINFVQAEDGFVSMRDYTLQMKMLDYLHKAQSPGSELHPHPGQVDSPQNMQESQVSPLYQRVHIALHAGELAEGLVAPESLAFHIRQAVELGHAERIGHGVDVMYEDDAPALLKELADKHVMVEINLSSNEAILGVKGAEHPFPLYRAAHVPVALSTDDEGVSRIDITHEYVRAALDYQLSYQDLKQLARTGMEHNFLPGESLWAAQDVFTAPVTACTGQDLGAEKPTPACKTFLDGNEKAAAQWELERRFRMFEAKF
jgi:adenosine deaminase